MPASKLKRITSPSAVFHIRFNNMEDLEAFMVSEDYQQITSLLGKQECRKFDIMKV